VTHLIFSGVCEDLYRLLDEIYWKEKFNLLYPQHTQTLANRFIYKHKLSQINRIKKNISDEIEEIAFMQLNDTYTNCPICESLFDSMKTMSNGQIQCINCQLTLGKAYTRGNCPECKEESLLRIECSRCSQWVCSSCYFTCEECPTMVCENCHVDEGDFYCDACKEDLSFSNSNTPEDDNY